MGDDVNCKDSTISGTYKKESCRRQQIIEPSRLCSRFIFKVVSIVSLVLFLFTLNISCTSNVVFQEEDQNKIYGPFSSTLSPDGKNIIFYWKKGLQGGISKLAIYEIETGRIYRFNLQDSYVYGDPVYSPDGKKIAFVAGEKFFSGNVFVMNVDGSDMRQLTFNSDKYPVNGGKYETNKSPSFSPDGKRIIFVRSGIILTRPTDMTANWNVYEVEISTGKENKLTDYRLFLISRPYFMPDGRSFVFSGDNFSKEYKKQYGENQIFILNDKNTDFKPAILFGESSFDPSIDRNGNIVFLARTNHLDGVKGPYMYDVFIMKKGQITRLTNMKFEACIFQPYISHNGDRIIFEACKKGKLGPTLWIMNGDGTGLNELKIDFSKWD
jgi:Tol biopolymer transport system component